MSKQFDRQFRNVVGEDRGGPASISEEKTDLFAVLSVIEMAEPRYDGGVPYDRVIQLAGREYGMDRTDVERAVEGLYAADYVEKPRADYLATTD